MRGRVAAVALALAVVAALGAACDDEPAPPAFPSSAFPSPTDPVTGPTGVSTGPTGSASGPTGALPSPGGTGDLTEGHLDLRVTGDVRAQATLPNLITGFVSPPPAGFAVVWTAGGADATTVGLGGAATVGTQPTSPTLVVTITVQTPTDLFSWTSMDGECEVTIASASTARFAGSFTCADLRAVGAGVVDVSGTFEATG